MILTNQQNVLKGKIYVGAKNPAGCFLSSHHFHFNALHKMSIAQQQRGSIEHSLYLNKTFIMFYTW